MRIHTRSSKPEFDAKTEIEPLIHKLKPVFSGRKCTILTFISAHPREGTTTVTSALALVLHDIGKRVLLVSNEEECMSGIVEAVAAGQGASSVLTCTEEGYWTGSWGSSHEALAQSSKLVEDPEFWKSLEDSFDVVVIDAPSLRRATEGVAYAQASHATVIVVEAENTRKPVVEHLRDTLTVAGAKIAGIVLNKRKFHIPQKVYDRL
ncbi:MAG: hypothetical protein PHW76_04830 [Alphaproteobacteria bacterium]|nr:hypothetical protein [Alphaproteobacteria bacterium]